MSEAKDDLKREKVRIVPISNIEDFPDHPFQVKDDESMDQLVESIRMNGVLNPVIALKIDENHYQLISGHRRKHACMAEQANLILCYIERESGGAYKAVQYAKKLDKEIINLANYEEQGNE